MRLSALFFLFLIIASLCQATTLRLHLDWYPTIEFAGIFVAHKKGWYRKAGIELVPMFKGLNIIERVVRGEADVGMHSGNEFIREVSRGAKLKAFAANFQFSPLNIVVRHDSDIHHVKDLKGKRIGLFFPSEKEFYRIVLANAKLTLKDVKFKKINTLEPSEVNRILHSKEVDACSSWEFNWPITFALLGNKVRQFPSSQNGFHFYGIVFFAKHQFIKRNRRLLRKFLEITHKGWVEAYKKPKFYTRFVIQKWVEKNRYILGSKDLTLKQQLLQLKLQKRFLFQGLPSGKFGLMTRYQWERSLRIAKVYGVVQRHSSVSVDDLFDESVLNLGASKK